MSRRKVLRGALCQTGQSTAELAVVVTALVLLLFGIIQMGLVVYRYNLICSAAREAVRYAIVHPSDSSGIKNTAINSAPFLSTSNITVNTAVPDPNGSTTKDAKVSISYPYNMQIPLMPSISFTLSSTSQMLRSQ